ncbi:protein KRI1 homolog isoform X2 [Dysidea avara]
MSDFKLTINKNYAQKYNKWKKSEELNKLKEKYGDEGDSDSSSSEIEDDTAHGVTAVNDKDFLKTLSLLKDKSPKIYSHSTKFYASEDESDSEKNKVPQTKPIYLKDYERNQLLEKGSKAFISDSEDNYDEATSSKTLSYAEEQEKLKQNVRSAIAEADNDTNEDFLSLRVKTKEEKKKDEEDYLRWIKGQKNKLPSKDKQDLDALRRYWNDPHLTEDEKFLRDYILNKEYLDKDECIPTYSEIVGSSAESEDERAVDEQEKFERKYNFRFEEPDSEFIASYPRTISGSVRATSTKRKTKRKERETRKEKEKEKRKEELKRLKNLKREAIMDKLDKLKSVTGNEMVGFAEDDFVTDFDPDQYDKRMSTVFGEKYYENDETEKPIFPSDEELDDYQDWDNWTGNQDEDDEGPHCEDPGFNMDADYTEETTTSRVSGKRRKRLSKFTKAVKKKKPKFNPDDQSFSEYFDEYYKLDYEDLIVDVPCRFKYRKVVANDFGLTSDEILTCDDKELNKWVSLKKMSQFRSDDEEKRDVRKYKKMSKQVSWKHKILNSLRK